MGLGQYDSSGKYCCLNSYFVFLITLSCPFSALSFPVLFVSCSTLPCPAFPTLPYPVPNSFLAAPCPDMLSYMPRFVQGPTSYLKYVICHYSSIVLPPALPFPVLYILTCSRVLPPPPPPPPRKKNFIKRGEKRSARASECTTF